MVIRNEFTNEEKFVAYLAEACNLLLVDEDEDKRIRGKNLEVFVAFVLAYNKFGSIVSKSARDWLLEYMSADKSFTEHSLGRYRKALVDKEWLEVSGTKDKQTFTIPPIFDFKALAEDRTRTFTISVNLKKDAVGSGAGENT